MINDERYNIINLYSDYLISYPEYILFNMLHVYVWVIYHEFTPFIGVIHKKNRRGCEVLMTTISLSAWRISRPGSLSSTAYSPSQ